jgi:hypothetical protein
MRRPALAFPWLLLFALLASTPLASINAEPPTGTRIDLTPGQPRASEVGDAETRSRFADAYAVCVARTHARAAENMLAEPYLSPAQTRIGTQISDSDCLGSNDVSLRYSMQVLVGRIAQIFIRERYANVDVARFAGLSDEAAAQLGLVARNNAEDMASCVLRRDPQAVRVLIDTAWESPQEAEAVRRIIPQLGPCASAGETFQLNATGVHVLLAAGLYRALSITSIARTGGS